MKGIGAFVLLLVLGLGITTYVVTRPPERGLDPEEATWVRDYVGWWRRAGERLETAYVRSRPSTPAINRRVFEPLRVCADSLARVGPAPKPLVPVEQAAQVACGEMQYALDLNDQYGISSIATTKQHLQGAAASLDLSARRIDNTLVIGKRLKTRSGTGDGSHVDRALSDAMSSATGQAVTVTCWSDGDWRDVRSELAVLEGGHRGLASLDAAAGVWLNSVHLAPATCAALAPLVETSDENEDDLTSGVRSLLVLGDEAAHAAGVRDEATAECHAVQYVRPAARALGASAAGAGVLAREARRLYRARSGWPTLWSPACRAGGPLDLHPGKPWP